MSSLAADFQVGYKSGPKASSFLWALSMSCLTTNCPPGGGVDAGNLVSKVFLLPCDCLKGFELVLRKQINIYLGSDPDICCPSFSLSSFFYCKESACFKKLVFN